MAEELNSYINILSCCLSGNVPSKTREAKDNVDNIINYFADDLSRSSIDAAFTSLFDKKTGILKFISSASKLDGFSDAIRESFVLLRKLLCDFKDRISPYVCEIRDLCKNSIVVGKMADEKEKAFEVMLAVVENEPWNIALEWSDIFRILYKPFTTNEANYLPGKVFQKQLHMLGVLARRHPDCVGKSERTVLMKIFISHLEKQVKHTSAVKYQVIVGCLNGLTEYLYSSPLKHDDPNCKRIYNCVKSVAQKHRELRVAPREALLLIEAHADQFAHHLCVDYKTWHEFLLKWVNSSGPDHKVGVRTLDTFYKQIVLHLKNKKTDSGQTMFKYFISYFKNIMSRGDASQNDMKLVIKAFGAFAAPCHTYMKQDDVLFMLGVVVQQAEQIYFREQELSDSTKIQNLPDYVESLSSIMVELDTISKEQLTSLQYLTVILIENFPKLLTAFHIFATRAICTALCNLVQVDGTVFSDFLASVVYQGLIRSCSHQLVIDAELQTDQLQDKPITYKDYVPLWKSLLRRKSLTDKGKSEEQADLIITRIYDEIIEATQTITAKLDLSTRAKADAARVSADVPIVDPESGLEANTRKDFQVFINLVDLIRDVLLAADPKLFNKWTRPFICHLITECSHKPLVSGFYKLLTVALQLCDTNSYFTGIEGVESQTVERRPLYTLVCSFLRELLLRLLQYKNDLEVACLETVLAAPIALVVPLIPHAAPAFQAVFRVGRSMLNLASFGLSALDKWTAMLPPHIMKPLLVQVLPHLDPFLRSKGIGGTEDVVVDLQLKLLSRKKRGGAVGTNKRVLRKRTVERPDSELAQLQKQIISFLGQLDCGTCLALLDDPYSQDMWGPCLQQPLQFSLPFKDMKLKVRLEKLIPEVVDLALSSSDRVTRFTACELLHAVVVFILGTGKELQNAHPDRYSEIVKKLCLPLLKLGCDPDQAVCSLYHLLVLQLAHWYSSRFMLRSKHTEIFIDTLMDGITHPTDTALRDLSAKCLGEFVTWSIKQMSDAELMHSPANIKAIMKQIYSLCLHPSPAKRLGAGLVVNCMYTVLREQEQVVNQFWLELLYYMVVNLSHADSIQGGQQQIVAALEHIERVLREKAVLFNKENAKRRKPPEFEGVTLKHAVCWLLLKCGTVQAECRHECMKMVDTLTPLLQDCKSTVEFVSWYIETYSMSSLVKICEGNEGIGTPDSSSVVHWLHKLLTSLECYVWLFGRKLVQPSVLFATGQPRIIEAVVLFVEKLSLCSAGEAVAEPMLFTPWEIESYNTSKCSVIVRILDMMSQVLQSNNKTCLTTLLQNSTLWQMIAECVFHPAGLGFDLRSFTIKTGLTNNLIEFLELLQKSLSLGEMSDLYSELAKIINMMKVNVFGNLQEMLRSDSVTVEQKQFVQGLEILQRSGMLSRVGSDGGVDGSRIMKDLFCSLIEEHGNSKLAVILKPSSQELAELLFKLAFLLNADVESVLSCLKESTVVENPLTKGSLLHGEHFFATLRCVILDSILQETTTFATCLLKDVSAENVHWVLSILAELVQQLAKIQNRGKTTTCLMEVIVNNFSRLSGFCASFPERIYELLGLLINLAKMSGNPIGAFRNHEVVCNWIIMQLMSQHLQLNHKTRALNLLVCLTGPQEESNIALERALQTFRDQHMPCMSVASVEYAGFIPAFKKILQILEDSGSCVVLRSVISMTASETEHVFEDEIRQSLQKFIRRLDFSNQVKAIEAVCKLFLDEQYDPDGRLNCAVRFIQPLLQGCKAVAAREFYKNFIKKLQSLVGVALDKRGGIAAEHQLVGKIGAWSLLELMFIHLDQSELESKECIITAAAFPGGVQTGKELISDLSNKAYNYRKENLCDAIAGNVRAVELFRKSQCAALNALVAIISNTKTDVKFYTGLIFNVNSASKEYVWKYLVDCSRSYSLTLDWAEIPKRRKHLVSIRREARSNRRETYGNVSQTVRYIPSVSQYLFDSTLNEDVTMFDLSTSIVCAEVMEDDLESESTAVSLEVDDLNHHECMATLCAMIRHMVDRGISAPPEPGAMADKLPSWMVQLHKCLDDSKQPRNVRLFLMKVVLNTEDKFRPYAHLWLNTILKVIDDGVVGSSPNYLLSDVVAMLVEWKSGLSCDDGINTDLLNQLLDLLIRNVQHSRRDVFKHNLELIRTVVELWKTSVQVPFQLLYDMIMRKDDKDPRISEPGIQVCAILLANSLSPWNNANKVEFMLAALRHMDGEKREIYQSSGEVVGLALKFLGQDSADFLTSVTVKLNSLKEKSKEKFITCLFGIQEHYPHIVRPFMRHVLFELPKVYGSFRVMCLKIVYSRLELEDKVDTDGDVPTDEIYVELKAKGLFKILSDRDPDQQVLALNIMNKIVPRLNETQLAEVVQVVHRLDSHQNKHCRSVMYEILMWVHDYCQEMSGDIITQAKSLLLKGLRDDDPFLQDMIFKYWFNSTRLQDVSTWRQLLHIMSDLYSPSAEHIFLCYLSQLLLEATADTPDYKQNIFKAPLSKCEFEDFKMLLSWRAQHTTAVPMFADTLVSQISQSQSLGTADPVLRATQNTLAFQPTLVQEDVSLNISSSLLYSIGSSQRKLYKMGPGFGSKKLAQSDEVDASKVEVPNLRRRFTRGDEHVKHNFYAGLEIKRNERRKQLEAERGRRREANIASFRNYRSGDFPDIEIPHSAIIKPLQELAKRVPTVARQLFVLVLDSLLSEMFDDERDLFAKRAEEAMNRILYQSKDYPAVLMGAIMQVALHNSKHFSLNPEYVAAASQVSGLLALGSLVLEETLIHRDDNYEAGPSKRCKPSHNELWVLLAELYSSMDEWDVVHGVFHSHLDCGDNVKEAIKWEACGNWSKARKMYAKSLSDMDSEDVLSDYCYEAFYKCLTNLSDWNELNKQIQQQIESNLDKLWEEWYQEKLLPQFVMSEVHLALDKGLEDSSREAFVSKVTEWLSDKEKSSHLSNYMSEELAMIFLLQDNCARANQQVQHTVNAFLNSWTNLDPLSHKLRVRQLLDLQKTAEIQAYLTFSTNCGNSKNKMTAKDLVKRWSNTLPLSTDPLLLWDARSMYRKKFAQKIEDEEAEHSLTCTQLAMVDSALCQNNFSVARKYLEQTIRKRDAGGDEFKLEWNLRYVKAKWLEMQLKEDVNRQLEMKLSCWDLLVDEAHFNKNVVARFPQLYVKILQQVSTITTAILQHIDDHPSVLTDVPQQVINKLMLKVGATDPSKSTVTDCLKKYGLRSLKETVEQENRNKNPEGIAQAYLQVAKYCRAYCKNSLNESEFGSEITTSVLRAMKYGSWEARQLFPCILQLPNLSSRPLSQLFSRESSDVPVWMLLGWVNQLLAHLNTQVGPVLYDMIRSLADTYPQAIIYGFQVSQENYELGDTQPGLKSFVEELTKKLFLNPVMETFLTAFSCLGQPCMMLKYFVNKLRKLIEDPRTNPKSLSFVYDTMMKELFSPCAGTKIHGKVFEDIKQFQSVLQKAGTKIKQGNKNVVKDLNQVLQKLQKRKTPVQVKDYSPWLSEFQASRYSGMDLEMPGQYIGESKPLLQHHVKIVGFKQTVEIMESKAMPMVLTMLGTDGKEHKYLVKFGEDLRQDQRLEQMFSIMNKTLKQNAMCRQRRLQIATYQVIPLSSHIGIVEWVNGTQVLGDLMTSAFEGTESQEYAAAQARYNEWISSSVKGKKFSSYLEMYGEAQLKFTRNQSIAAFREKVNMVPWDLLRRAIFRLSVSPESYFALRQNFACSYAVMCIAHWLLGIGDRHLNNTLVTLRDGRCVGIDFGMSFGAATQFLQVPELMPFRLTPHIVNLLQPLEETGLLRETMIHCLRTLRNSTDLLLATMEVFVQEPSMDWLDFAQKHESLNKDSKQESQEWYPQQKLDMANLKLQGANPAFITTKELEAGFKNLKYLPKYLEAARGIPTENVRARLPMTNLTTEQQVDCLLDQAMDYNILSRTWVGWHPWM